MHGRVGKSPLDQCKQLLDTSPEAETVRDAVRRIRADFELHEEPHTLIENYDVLLTRLEALVYEPVRNVQDLPA